MVLHVNILYYYYTGISDNTCNITRPVGHNTLGQYRAAVTVATVTTHCDPNEVIVFFVKPHHLTSPQRKHIVAALCSA